MSFHSSTQVTPSQIVFMVRPPAPLLYLWQFLLTNLLPFNEFSAECGAILDNKGTSFYVKSHLHFNVQYKEEEAKDEKKETHNIEM